MGKWCPFVRGQCKKEECQFYIFEEMINTRTGEKLAGFDCLFSLQYSLARMEIEETMRLQVGIQKFLNQSYANMLALIDHKVPPALSGNPEQDRSEILKMLEEHFEMTEDKEV